jgi:aspartyl-tRNA(Asn)/glutamyl-tRNA(Gln) amidotransferase subunit A
LKNYTSLSQIRTEITAGTLTCRQLTEYYLQNIRNRLNLNAFLEVYETEALRRADETDAKIQAGTAGKLAGMVMGLKDVLAHQNHHLQASSRILDGFVSQFTATAVQRLLDEDAIIIGRLNCDEFAMGSSNENSAFGNVLNPVDEARVPGGSSGGSAVAVAADLCLATLGSDTGGSVRQPAAFCGVIGLKPTYSRISRYGLAAYASSFDCIGIFGKSMEDVALLLEVIAGGDDFDSTVSHLPVPAYSQALEMSHKPRVAYLRETVESKGLAPEIKEKTIQVLDWLRNEGCVVEEVEFPLLRYILPTYYILTTAEASSNLSRYDGVRYGFRSPQTSDLESMYKKTRFEGFGEEVKRRIMLGTYVLSANYYDAYYTKAQRVRRLIKERTDAIFAGYDFIVLPTTPTTAFRFGENTEDPIQMYLADLFTVQANVTGIPAISIPNGVDNQGLPIGLQIMAKPFDEARLLAFANWLKPPTPRRGNSA